MPKWLFQAFSYFRYLIKSKKGTLAHSPFVFDLARFVVYQPAENDLVAKSKNYRKVLLGQNHSTFSKVDFGTGESRTETVSKLGKSSSIRKKYGELLARLVNYQKPKNILEFGTCLGMSTQYLSFYSQKITTVEGCPNTQKIAMDLLSQSVKNIAHFNFVNCDFDSFLSSNSKSFDFVFIDGNHAYEPTIKYFNTLWDQLPENGLIILDDIHWSVEMEKAWHKIINETLNLVSIDFFQIGLCYKRSFQEKEHFIFSY